MRPLKYDAGEVSPFPPDRDPEIAGVKRRTRRRRPRIELPAELEPYRLYSVADLNAVPTVRWLIPEYLAAGELSVLYGSGATYKSFVALDWSCELARRGHLVIYAAAE